MKDATPVRFSRPKDSTPPPAPAPARQARGRAARTAGYLAEDAAAAYLAGQGVRILERNVRSKGGEIDLVGFDGATLVFVEVRQRSGSRFGGAAASITAVKQARIVHAARLYLLRQPALEKHPCRFDCVLIDSPGQYEWLRDAFRLD